MIRDSGAENIGDSVGDGEKSATNVSVLLIPIGITCFNAAPTIERAIPSASLDYDKTLYRTRHKIENLFAKLKDWRRIVTRYDRCAHTFFSAICIATAIVAGPHWVIQLQC